MLQGIDVIVLNGLMALKTRKDFKLTPETSANSINLYGV